MLILLCGMATLLKSTHLRVINIQNILDFINQHHFCPQDIRNTVKHLSWTFQMKRVIDEA